MSEVANIYDNGPISPIAKIKENLSIYTQKQWAHYNIAFLEPWPRSSQLVIDMVTASGAATIAANGTIAKRIVTFLQPTDLELLHVRWEPIDDVEGILWEQAGTGRFQSWNTQSRVTRFTHVRDPFLAGTTFWILGKQRDMNLEARNPNPAALPGARFVFQGYRYVLEMINPVFPPNYSDAEKTAIRTALAAGDKSAVDAWIGKTTWLPAEGR